MLMSGRLVHQENATALAAFVFDHVPQVFAENRKAIGSITSVDPLVAVGRMSRLNCFELLRKVTSVVTNVSAHTHSATSAGTALAEVVEQD